MLPATSRHQSDSENLSSTSGVQRKTLQSVPSAGLQHAAPAPQTSAAHPAAPAPPVPPTADAQLATPAPTAPPTAAAQQAAAPLPPTQRQATTYTLDDRRLLLDLNVRMASMDRDMAEVLTHFQDIRGALGLPF